MSNVTRTERGWAGHFICASSCSFRRNTLLERGGNRIVVSTVGLMRDHKGEIDTIGCERYYETMVFDAKWEEPYWEADVSKQLDFDAEWSLNEAEQESDQKANDMHEAVVSEFIGKMEKIK